MIDGCELMEAALESFPEGLALLSREGEVDHWNRAAANITGFPIIDMRSRSVPWAQEPLSHRANPDGARGASAPEPFQSESAPTRVAPGTAAASKPPATQSGLGSKIKVWLGGAKK